MTIYKIWCEWDMDFNMDNEGTYPSNEARLKALESVDWTEVGFDSWQEVKENGLLELSEQEM